MNENATLKITLVKSLIGRNVKHIATAKSLGLKKPGDVTVQPKNGFTDRLSSGETTSKDQRIILTPYTYWHNKCWFNCIRRFNFAKNIQI